MVFVGIRIFINVDKRIEEPKQGFIPFVGYYNEYILDILKIFSCFGSSCIRITTITDLYTDSCYEITESKASKVIESTHHFVLLVLFPESFSFTSLSSTLSAFPISDTEKYILSISIQTELRH